MAAQKVLFLAILVLLPAIALGGSCTCEEEDEDHNRNEALKYKLCAIASILLASFIGVSLPVLGKRIPALSPENDLFFIIKSFAAGVILATGFIHVLPDAFESLTNPCLSEKPWDFPFAGFVAMLCAIGTLMVDVFATSHYQKSSKSDRILQIVERDEQNSTASGVLPLYTHATHGHAHGSSVLPLKEDPASVQIRYRVISQVLELGIIVHSVIIGIALGASDSPKTVKTLLAALTFHQFFEGIGLGGCIAQAKFKLRAFTIMAAFFSLTTPAGIAIGIWISNVYKENSPRALIVQGIFNSASAGILIYMALVDLLSADFMNPRMQSNGKLLMGANASLLIGAGGMSFLANWA